jgi:hypothetical protein
MVCDEGGVLTAWFHRLELRRDGEREGKVHLASASTQGL